MTADKNFLTYISQVTDERSSENLTSVESLAFSVAEGEEHRLCCFAMLCWGEAGMSRLVEAAIIERSPKRISNIMRLLTAVSSGDLSVGSMFSNASLPLVRKLSTAVNGLIPAERAHYFLCRTLNEGDAQDLLAAMGICFSQFDQSEYAMIAGLVDAAGRRWPRVN